MHGNRARAAHAGVIAGLLALVALAALPAAADETCNSPYMANLIKGQEDYVYVWTLGRQGHGRRLGQARDHRRRTRSRSATAR